MIQRKGRATKWQKIQKNLERATTISEACLILEPFNLTNEEACRIAQQWQLGRQILARHGVI